MQGPIELRKASFGEARALAAALLSAAEEARQTDAERHSVALLAAVLHHLSFLEERRLVERFELVAWCAKLLAARSDPNVTSADGTVAEGTTLHTVMDHLAAIDKVKFDSSSNSLRYALGFDDPQACLQLISAALDPAPGAGTIANPNPPRDFEPSHARELHSEPPQKGSVTDLLGELDSLTGMSIANPNPPEDSESSHARELHSEPPQQGSVTDLLGALDSLTGMEEVKDQIAGLVARFTIDQQRGSVGLGTPRPSMHLLFTGRPGTGKTTAARLVGSILHAAGLLRKGHLVEVDRTGLVGQHMGSTGVRTGEALDLARGGVLLIDEAYSLVNEDRDTFGREALDAIVKGMEDYRHDLVVIMTGYPAQMNKLLTRNPGLQSRFAAEFTFPDYDDDELLQILTDMAEDADYDLPAGGEPLLRAAFAKARAERAFGNARYVRNLLDDMISEQAQRLSRLSRDGASLAVESLREIALVDLQGALGSDESVSVFRAGGYRELADQLRERVIGQDNAVDQLAKVVALSRAQLDLHPEGPNGVFLLAGPTGTGKTELARALSHVLHGSEKSLIQLDMSEYSTGLDVSKLIGSALPDGPDRGGRLTTQVQERPEAVIVLDEFEKSHPAVWNAFLQVFDEGRLTDADGQDADFSSTVLLLTTNLGAEAWERKPDVGFANDTPDDDARAEQVRESIGQILSPEMVNRFDGILVFRPLSPEVIHSVAAKAIADYCDRIQRWGWRLEVSDEVVALVAQRGYSYEHGARNLERQVEATLARELLDLQPGPYRVSLDSLGGLEFAPAPTAPTAA